MKPFGRGRTVRHNMADKWGAVALESSLKGRLAALEVPVSPPARAPHEPINYLDRVATLPPNVIADMAAALPDTMVRGIVADSRRSAPSEPVEAPSGEPRPLESLPRAELADAIVDRLAPKAG
jgi:hypothetical protein